MNIGQNIKKARCAAGMTQKQLADAIGVYAKDVCRWENGEYVPGLKAFSAICRELNVSSDDLLELKR